MSILQDTFNHFFSLDWGWLVGLFNENLFWVFIFAAVAVMLYEHRWFWGAIFLFLFLWAFVDFIVLTGWVFPPMLVFIDFLFAIAIFNWDKPGSWLSRHFGWVSVVRFTSLFVIFNLLALGLI